MAQHTITNTILVGAPIDTTFARLADVDHHLDLFTHFKEMRNYHGGAVQVGDEWQMVARNMGRDMVSNWRMAELVAPNHLRFTSQFGGNKFRNDWHLEPVDEQRTRLTHELQVNFGGILAPILSLLFKGPIEKGAVGELETIKSVVESEEGQGAVAG